MAWRHIVVDVVDRLTKIETKRARQAAKQGPEKFHAWIEEFYPVHAIRLREALEPAVRSWGDLRGLNEDWQGPLEALVAKVIEQSTEELLGAKVSVLADDVEARVSRWERERPGEVADLILEA